MNISVIFKNARCAALELSAGTIFETEHPWNISINGKFYKESNRVITMIYDLKPETEYEIKAEWEGEEAVISFKTDYEFISLNVKEFGAKGDGMSDDTPFIQAAIMACPPDSRVVIPAGEYKITSLFLKDNLNLELQEGAVLSAWTEREKFPVLQGVYTSTDGKGELILGNWEGEAMPMFAGIITGINVKNAVVYGSGTINGNASRENWWDRPKEIRIAARPRMIFLNRCENMVFAGVTVKNSPSWNVHPFFCKHLKFIGMSILGPKDSPNTDGLDPESCDDVEITGVYFSVGDDCIAVKSGKIEVGAKYKTPSSNVTIRQCCMRDGHGSITLGSEMAGGVKNLRALDCMFLHTDRGLRIKTRRGRGKDAVIDGILFEHIKMDHVMTPFVINSFYFCDKDGHTDYVQCKDPLPVDDRTPFVKSLTFHDIHAENCHVAAAFFYGLPEQKIQQIEMKNVYVNYADKAMSGKPAMMDGIPDEICKMGIYANNISKLVLENVKIEGADGEAIHIENVDHIVE